MSDIRKSPIGVFDSGMGGVRVLKELVRLLPDEDFIYYGDSANAPYGTKSPAEIRACGVSCAERLLKSGVKAIFIACNTATSACAEVLRAEHPEIPIIGMEPALKPAVEACPGGNIVVMATPATLKLEKFERLLEQYRDKAHVSLFPVYGLIELIEQGITEGPQIRDVLSRHFSGGNEKQIDAVVLGCTHFPLIKKEIQEVLGDDILLFDGEFGAARHLKDVLEKEGLKKPAPQKDGGSPPAGSVTFLNSLQNIEVLEQMTRLFNM